MVCMTDANEPAPEFTRDHHHALESLKGHESKQKGARRWLATAVLTAVGTLGGTVGKHYFDYRTEQRSIEREAHDEAGDELTSEERHRMIRAAIAEIDGDS